MIETQIAITVNRKSDFNLIEQKIIEHKIRFPVYMREYEHHYQINFTGDYEEWELDSAILQCFPGYTYVTDLGRGGDEIRLEISRYQSGYSTDGWDRVIENPLNETKYLVKKSMDKREEFNPTIKVLFENQEQYYHVNIVGGVNKTTNEQGFLLANDFKTKNEDNSAIILKDRLYPSDLDAFDAGYYKLQTVAEDDFILYQQNKKKAEKELQKPFRKIIRDFIKACNNCDEAGVLQSLYEQVSFEKCENLKSAIRTEGITAFKEHLQSAEQELCGKNFSIRSSWSFNLPCVDINMDYLSTTTTNQQGARMYKHKFLQFKFEENKIINIIDYR